MDMIFPSPLREGDKIAIVSPASPVNPDFIDGAVAKLTSEGYRVEVFPGAKGPSEGSYAAPLATRLADLRRAWTDPEVKAILCSRGGYGAVHLLPHLDPEMIRANPKWLIGFSDISALHALCNRAGVASIHGSMAKAFTAGDENCESIIRILRTGEIPAYALQTGGENGDSAKSETGEKMEPEDVKKPLNIDGEGVGMLVGGNMAVLDGLAGTSYDLLAAGRDRDVVLFIEDIAEPQYKIERMLYGLLLRGGFNRVKGLIVGDFTESRPDRNHASTHLMIEDFLRRNSLTRFPVAFGVPVGHADRNLPFVTGSEVRLSVDGRNVKIAPPQNFA